MDTTIICKIQDLIHQYSKENIVLWINIYEDFLQYFVRINYIKSGNIISWQGDVNVPFATINEISDNDIIENIRHFVEEAKKQIKEEK